MGNSKAELFYMVAIDYSPIADAEGYDPGMLKARTAMNIAGTASSMKLERSLLRFTMECGIKQPSLYNYGLYSPLFKQFSPSWHKSWFTKEPK